MAKLLTAGTAQTGTVYSPAWEHPGGDIDFDLRGTMGAATAVKLMYAPRELGAATAANYRLAHADASLTGEDVFSGQLPAGYVCLKIEGGDGSTSLDGYVALMKGNAGGGFVATGVTPS
jgi:hypothetical protein